MSQKEFSCEKIEKELLEDDGLHDKQNFYSRHIASCPDCRRFLANLDLIRRSVGPGAKVPVPRSDIFLKLKTELENKSQRTLSIAATLKSLLKYPIPAYQVAGGFILLLVLAFGYGIISDRGPAASEMNTSFYLADSTQDPEYTLGESVNEDTIWVKHMVTF